MRGKGEGTIRQRADGRWEARIDLGRGLDGKRRRKSVFAATQADVVYQLRTFGGRGRRGARPDDEHAHGRHVSGRVVRDACRYVAPEHAPGVSRRD